MFLTASGESRLLVVEDKFFARLCFIFSEVTENKCSTFIAHIAFSISFLSCRVNIISKYMIVP